MRIKLNVPRTTYDFIDARRMGAHFHVAQQCWYLDAVEMGDWIKWLKPADRITIKAQFARKAKLDDSNA